MDESQKKKYSPLGLFYFRHFEFNGRGVCWGAKRMRLKLKRDDSDHYMHRRKDRLIAYMYH